LKGVFKTILLITAEQTDIESRQCPCDVAGCAKITAQTFGLRRVGTEMPDIARARRLWIGVERHDSGDQIAKRRPRDDPSGGIRRKIVIADTVDGARIKIAAAGKNLHPA